MKKYKGLFREVQPLTRGVAAGKCHEPVGTQLHWQQKPQAAKPGSPDSANRSAPGKREAEGKTFSNLSSQRGFGSLGGICRRSLPVGTERPVSFSPVLQTASCGGSTGAGRTRVEASRGGRGAERAAGSVGTMSEPPPRGPDRDLFRDTWVRYLGERVAEDLANPLCTVGVAGVAPLR